MNSCHLIPVFFKLCFGLHQSELALYSAQFLTSIVFLWCPSSYYKVYWVYQNSFPYQNSCLVWLEYNSLKDTKWSIELRELWSHMMIIWVEWKRVHFPPICFKTQHFQSLLLLTFGILLILQSLRQQNSACDRIILNTFWFHFLDPL